LLYIFSGQDDYSIAHSLDEIQRDINDRAISPAGATRLDGQQVTLNQLRAVCQGAPLLGERQLVIIEGLLGRFQSQGRARRQKKNTGSTESRDDYKSLTDYINQIPDSTVLVLVEEAVDKRNPAFRKLASRAIIKDFPLLRGPDLRQWVQKRVKNGGSSISPQAVNVLTRTVGSSLWIMASEIGKLTQYASGRRIEEDDVKAVVGYIRQTNVFAMIDAIFESNTRVAEQILVELVKAGATSSYLLTMLTRQVRLVVRSKELVRQKKPRNEIMSRLGITSEFALGNTLEQGRKYSLVQLKEVYHKLLEADLSIKTGEYNNELALHILVTELCQRGNTPLAGARPRPN